jgi:hypothetical protein
VEKVPMEMILGHSLHGMDIHYLVPTEENLRKAMDRYMERQDGELVGVRVDKTRKILQGFHEVERLDCARIDSWYKVILMRWETEHGGGD